MNRQLPFTRYVWCYACSVFDAHTMSEEHDRALNAPCPRCGSNDICSKPPEHHKKHLAKIAHTAELATS